MKLSIVIVNYESTGSRTAIPHRVIGNSAMQFIEESQHSDLNEYRLFAIPHCVCVCNGIYIHTLCISVCM